MACGDRGGLTNEIFAGLRIRGLGRCSADFRREMFEVQGRKLGKRQIKKRDPGRSFGDDVEPGQDQEFARPRSGDIPEADALAVELGLLGVPRRVVACGLHPEDRAVEAVVGAIDDRAFRRHDLGHGVDRQDDRPLQPLCGVHGVKRDGLLLGVGPAFDGARFVGPGCSHRLGEGAQTPDRIGAAEC